MANSFFMCRICVNMSSCNMVLVYIHICLWEKKKRNSIIVNVQSSYKYRKVLRYYILSCTNFDNCCMCNGNMGLRRFRFSEPLPIIYRYVVGCAKMSLCTSILLYMFVYIMDDIPSKKKFKIKITFICHRQKKIINGYTEWKKVSRCNLTGVLPYCRSQFSGCKKKNLLYRK